MVALGLPPFPLGWPQLSTAACFLLSFPTETSVDLFFEVAQRKTLM